MFWRLFTDIVINSRSVGYLKWNNFRENRQRYRGGSVWWGYWILWTFFQTFHAYLRISCSWCMRMVLILNEMTRLKIELEWSSLPFWQIDARNVKLIEHVHRTEQSRFYWLDNLWTLWYLTINFRWSWKIYLLFVLKLRY